MMKNSVCIVVPILQLAICSWQLAAQDISSFQDNTSGTSSYDFPEIVAKTKKSLAGTSLSALEQKLKSAEQKNDFKEAASAASTPGLPNLRPSPAAEAYKFSTVPVNLRKNSNRRART